MQMTADDMWGAKVKQAFGDRLRDLRHQLSITQEGLALRCGLDRSYVGQVERGERNISLENIYRLAEGLGIPPSELLVELDGLTKNTSSGV
ncbi:Helix-turn-helix [Pseudomonas marginalis]|nr:Helix-turn-helix [Pseudomonas marginalis]